MSNKLLLLRKTFKILRRLLTEFIENSFDQCENLYHSRILSKPLLIPYRLSIFEILTGMMGKSENIPSSLIIVAITLCHVFRKLQKEGL